MQEKLEDKKVKIDLREKILKANDLKTEKVMIPEWTDSPLYIRPMTGKERDDFEQEMLRDNETDGTKSLKNFRARLLVRTLCEDEEGKIRIFTDMDAEALGDKNAASLDKCIEAAKSLSGISEKDQDKILKNSKATQE